MHLPLYPIPVSGAWNKLIKRHVGGKIQNNNHFENGKTARDARHGQSAQAQVGRPRQRPRRPSSTVPWVPTRTALAAGRPRRPRGRGPEAQRPHRLFSAARGRSLQAATGSAGAGDPGISRDPRGGPTPDYRPRRPANHSEVVAWDQPMRKRSPLALPPYSPVSFNPAHLPPWGSFLAVMANRRRRGAGFPPYAGTTVLGSARRSRKIRGRGRTWADWGASAWRGEGVCHGRTDRAEETRGWLQSARASSCLSHWKPLKS